MLLAVICHTDFHVQQQIDQLALGTFSPVTTPGEDLVGDRQKTRIRTSAESYHRTWSPSPLRRYTLATPRQIRRPIRMFRTSHFNPPTMEAQAKRCRPEEYVRHRSCRIPYVCIPHTVIAAVTRLLRGHCEAIARLVLLGRVLSRPTVRLR